MLVEVGPVKTFGLLLALAFLSCGAVIARRLREQGRPVDMAYELMFAAIVGGLVGARLLWLVENPDEADLSGIFGSAGLTFYGGAVGGALAVVFYVWRKGMLGGWLLDLAAVPLAIGYAIGRLGCQTSGDGDYGQEWSGPWAMPFPDGTEPIDVPVHPTPLYETLAMGLVAWGLWRLRDRVRPGGLFALWLIAAGVERFLVELIRRNDAVLAGLTLPQVQSVVLALIGVVLLVVWRGPFERQRANGGGTLKAAA
jgi:phosphatidylglycerol---prolipoprotein diacylglyceryl transferase